MKISRQNTDQAVLTELGARLLQARLQRNWTQQELAEAAGISKRTVERAEAGESNQLSSVIRLFRALELIERFDTLLPETGPSPIEQLKRKKQQRQRASSARKAETPGKPWKWGDEQ